MLALACFRYSQALKICEDPTIPHMYMERGGERGKENEVKLQTVTKKMIKEKNQISLMKTY